MTAFADLPRPSRRRIDPLTPLALLLALLSSRDASASSSSVDPAPIEPDDDPNAAPTCSAGPLDDRDPNLQTHTFDVGYGEEEFDFYVTPDVSNFYGEEPGSRKAVKPAHVGLAGRFVNASPRHTKLWWDPKDGRGGSYIGACAPFGACGTATFPTHRFYFTSNDDHGRRLWTGDAEEGHCVNYYDPYLVEGDEGATERNLEGLSLEDRERWEGVRHTRLFNEVYREVAGRDYIVSYGRAKPMHYMWRADRFGQEHWVTSRETHFAEHPSEELLGRIKERGEHRILKEDEPRLLQEYRNDDAYINMTLKVLSCAPRVFEIRNFLSPVEVEHILYLATGIDLRESSTGDSGGAGGQADSRSTRTSRNSWVSREQSPVIDAVYRRAADLMRIDEAMLRFRGEGEAPEAKSRTSLAEQLQLVHYSPGQEYTAHHDFGYRAQTHPLQPDRFATLLLYLNEGMGGGETSFPRWLNAETSEQLKVTPEVGKAVLFYSQLPDGNMDDLSQHAALPVTNGEKWLINLWVRDPIYN